MRGRTLSAGVALAVFAGMTVTLAAQPVTASPTTATTVARPIAGTAAALAAPDISVTNVQAHLTQFNSIATGNGGNRRAGSAGYTVAGQCSALQGGGEGPRWEGRQGPSSALNRAVLLLDVLTHDAQRCRAHGAHRVRD
ncbi:hypothetical protein JOD64_005928 [Micromonospora luteifusca]|uniref:Uncharacterized protein n=1 Tax=Micromonospora luteifusca TaxID=709860 RepID=A0ABS2M2U2_9ACTN|nr:hypothetical protein [Micromonospora luteifusca]MBM7494706.1 hypothetical protein [Micromonospora luteifusca]